MRLKIQNLPNLRQPFPAKPTTSKENERFSSLLPEQLKNETPEPEKEEYSNPIPLTLKMNRNNIMALSAVKQIKPSGFTTLLSDALSDVGGKILQTINEICDEDPDESIDMALIDELLTLHSITETVYESEDN